MIPLGCRLLEREAEQRQLRAELQYLEDRRERRRDDVPQEEVQRVLREMRATWDGSDLKAKRALLKKLVAWVELGKDGGKVALAFPLSSAGLYAAPPREFFTKVRTLVYAAPESLDR